MPGMKMRLAWTACLLTALAAGTSCASRSAPPPPAPTAASDAVRVARIVRLMELNRNRVALEVERAGLSERYGERHPEMLRIASQLAVVDAAIAREFLPEEQAAVSAYEDRAVALRLQLQAEMARGRGENHPEVVSVKRQLAAIERMAGETRAPRNEAMLLARIQQDPLDPAPQIELGLLYLRAGRNADATRALERGLRLLRHKR